MENPNEAFYKDLKENEKSGADIFESEMTTSMLQSITGKSTAQINCDLTQLRLYQKKFRAIMGDNSVIATKDISQTILRVIHESLDAKLVGRNEVQKINILLGMYQRITVLLGEDPTKEDIAELARQETMFIQWEVEKKIENLTQKLLDEYQASTDLKVLDNSLKEEDFSADTDAIRMFCENANAKNILEIAAFESVAAQDVLQRARKADAKGKAYVLMMVLLDIAALIAIILTICAFFSALESGVIFAGHPAIAGIVNSAIAMINKALAGYHFSVQTICLGIGVCGWGYLSERFMDSVPEVDQNELKLSAASYVLVDDITNSSIAHGEDSWEIPSEMTTGVDTIEDAEEDEEEDDLTDEEDEDY